VLAVSRGWLVIPALLLALLLEWAPLYAADVTLSGRVVDEDGTPVSDARISVHAAASPDVLVQAQTSPSGAFEVALPGPGDYLIDVERQGYYALKNHPAPVEVAQDQKTQEVTLTINTVREVFQSVDVNEQVSPVDITQTSNQEHLTGTEINNVPYPNSHSLRESMNLMPGVLLDPGGALHFNGSQESQVQYVLNGFNITDPITSLFGTLLAAEGIRELAYSSGRDSPQFGKGSAGVLAISTETGTDTFHYTATDFIPGVSIQRGVRIGNWYPRFGVSGPILRGKAWFSDSFASEYTNTLVNGLPSGQDTSSGWAGSNLFHVQWNLTPSQILFADLLVNVNNQNRAGLGPLDPISTTSNTRTRKYFGSIKDQFAFGHGALAEFGYAHNDFDDAQTPQGAALYVFSPAGRSGNYFVDSRQRATRDQGLAHVYLPAFHFAGTHQIEVGADADLLHYNADFQRTGYEVIGLSGQLLSETMFQGSGVFHLPDAEMSSYVLDTWRVAPRFQLSLGLRQDWERRTGDLAWSPRAAFSWAPLKSGRTRIAGGYSVTRDAVPLETLGRSLDQSALTTDYNIAGMPTGPAALTAFAIPNGGLKLPRAANWSLNVDHKVSQRMLVSAKVLRRRLTDGFVYLNTLDPEAPPSELPVPGGTAPGTYQLGNIRRDDYDSEQISVKQTLSGQYEWMVSYVHSRAVSNAFLDSNALDPQQALPYFAPMPWNAPNRLLGWAYLPLSRALPRRLRGQNWAIAVLADARSGFPFSVQDQAGLVVGDADSHRYPFNFDLNVALERVVTLRGYRFALRGGVDNLTNQSNPTAVNNVIGAPQYLQFLGQEGRHYVVRIRFFGRAGTK
jgi:hypothetical protein